MKKSSIIYIMILKRLIITEILEVVCAYFIGIREKHNIKIIILTNALTNVLLNLLLKYIVSKECLFLSGNLGIDYYLLYYIAVVIMEIIIIVLEAIIYKREMIIENELIFEIKINGFYIFLLISFILNITSILGGMVIG